LRGVDARGFLHRVCFCCDASCDREDRSVTRQSLIGIAIVLALVFLIARRVR
jgi:hypothetical protein